MQTNAEIIAKAIERGDFDEVEVLLQNEPQLTHTVFAGGGTPLHLATLCNHKAIVDLLISNGADVNATDDDGNSPILSAVFDFEAGDRIEVMKALVAHGADVNSTNTDGLTPLHNAAMNGKGKIAEFLLANNADPTLKSKHGVTPQQFAVAANHHDIAALLNAAAQNNFGGRANQITMTYYYRDTAGHEVGPVSEDEIHTFRAGGLLLDTTPVRAADSADWTSYVEKFGRIAATKGGASGGPKFTFKHWFAIGLVAAAVPLFYGIKQEHTLSFALSLDGKDLQPPKAPSVSVDGAPFPAGNRISAGRHLLVVQLEGAEPIERHFWVVFGTKDLGALALESSKGSLFVSANPLPATAIVQDGNEAVRQGAIPLTVESLPVGDYTVLVRRGEYEERRQVKIQRQQRTEANIELNLGSIDMSAQPPEADFTLSGNGRSWQGTFPTRLDDVPAGTYRLVASRKGWSLETDIQISRGNVSVNKVEFPYGGIELTSDPAGLALALNGVPVGKTPLNLRELKPGPYTLTATDGEYERNATITVNPKEQARHSFAFRYGTVELTSIPAGATVIRNGKEIGITPLTLKHLAVDVSGVVELQLNGYAPAKDFALNVVEGVTTNLSAKLFSEKYFQAIKLAHEALDAAQFAESNKFIAAALDSEPNDPVALKLRNEVSKAEEALRREQANAKVQALASLPWFDFQKIIADCMDTRQVRVPVELEDGYNQNYIDNNGKRKTRFVRTGTRTEIRTSTESVFNDASFTAKYTGKTYKFDSAGWKIAKIEKDGTAVFRRGSGKSLEFGQIELRAIPAAANQVKFLSLNDSKRITIRAKIGRHDQGDFFSRVLHRIYLEDAEIMDQMGESVPSSAVTIPKQQNDVSGDSPSSGLIDELVTIENQLAECAKNGDRSGVDSMLDPGFTLVQDGRRFSRSDYLSTIKPIVVNVTFAIESPKVQLENGHAVLTGYVTLQMRQQGQTKSIKRKFRDVFVQGDGRWILRSAEVISGPFLNQSP